MNKLSCGELISELRSCRQDDVCFIIGGGPSKNKYLPDDSVLYNKSVITTNNAYKLFPNAVAAHFADQTWYSWHKDTIHTTFKGPVTTASKLSGIYEKTPVIPFMKETSKYVGLPLNSKTLCGNNAGHQAISLAYLIGYTTIVLIGFDMDPNAQLTHWHNEHKTVTNKSMYELTMIPGLKRVADEIKETDIEIINVNKDSHIKCFKYVPIEKFL